MHPEKQSRGGIQAERLFSALKCALGFMFMCYIKPSTDILITMDIKQ